MKKKYKIYVFIIIIVLITNISSPIMAIAMTRDKNEEKLKKICGEVKNICVKNQIQDLIEEGMTPEDAEYYLKLNTLIKRLEDENIEISLDKSREKISDFEFSANKGYYRDKILQGDKGALKKAMESLDTLINSSVYVEKVISTFSNKGAIEILYPNGTKISYRTGESIRKHSDHKEENFQKNSVFIGKKAFNEVTHLKCQRIYEESDFNYEETIMEEGITNAFDKLEVREGEWTFQCELAFSKVYLYTEYQLEEDGVSEIKYARGGQCSYGMVNIANSTGGIISRARSQGEELPAEARNEVIFTVSGAFGASFLILSLSVEPGMNWTQYIIFRLYHPEIIEGEYRALYQWYAADYK